MSEQLVEVNNDCSFQRALPTKHRNHRMRAVNRFLNPVMKVMCTTSQPSPAMGIFEGLASAYKQLQPTRFEDLFVLEQSKLL